MVLIWAIALAELALPRLLQQSLRLFPRRVRLHRLRQPPRLGLCRPAAAHSVSRSRICRAVLGDSLRSIRFIPALASSLLVVQTALIAREFGGRRFRLASQRRYGADRAAVPFQRQPARHQLPRTESLDGLRLLRDSRHQAQRPALLALVRRCRGTRPGREVHDRAFRLRNCRWPAAHRTSPRLPR